MLFLADLAAELREFDELAVAFAGLGSRAEPSRWQDDPQASEIMVTVIQLGREHGVPVIPVYAVSDTPAASIVDLAATIGADILMLGSTHRRTLVSLLKGSVANEVARQLPENISLLIHG